MLHNHHPSAIVIGSGVAGMATAIRLAVQGFKVDVFEKNDRPGGKISVFSKEGYQFDAGPSLFTQPENIAALFELAGELLSDYFTYHKCTETCRYFFGNGRQVTAYADQDLLAKELNEKLGESEQAVKKYLQRSGDVYNNIGQVFLNHSLHKRNTWLNKRIFPALRTVRFPYLFSSLHQYNKTSFNTVEAAQLFDRFATYNGSDPYKAPAMLSLIPHLEHNEGTYYPHGGMIAIADALHKLALKKSVRFHFNTAVERIIRTGGKIKGVVVNGKNQLADVVISNMDAYFTYERLLNDQRRAKRVLRQERSSSALIFYWGIRKTFPQLGLHNILFSKDYKAEFDAIFSKKILFADPTVYINISSKNDAAHAPAGGENWFVMINVPAGSSFYNDTLKMKARQSVIEKISSVLGIDIAPLIVTETVNDPAGIESQTSSYMGSLYGTSSNSAMAAFFRHPNFSGSIRNLYFCGGSVHPGGGIPLCFKSAMITSSLIKKDIEKLRH